MTDSSDHSQSRTTCQRCGTCCRKGGPTLHSKDRGVVEKGIVPLAELFTIRKGEMALDNVRGALAPVANDHIKLKGNPDDWTCCRFDEERNACTVYNDRPLECRLLKCWDTHEIERIYGRNLLSRDDLIGGVEGLWDLVSDHQDRCSYEKARELMQRLNAEDGDRTRRDLLEMIQYDIEIRRLVTAKGTMNADVLDFLFGRPMGDVLKAEGLNLRSKTS